MKRLMDSANTHETDVLVVGGGIAACLAAIEARGKGLDVILVDKATVGRSGVSPLMSGVLESFDPEEDSYDDWFKRIFEIGQYINEQDILGQEIKESTGIVRDLQTWGVEFKKKDGKIERFTSVGRHVKIKMVNGGLQLMNVVRGEVIRRGVHVIERVMVFDLLTSDGESLTEGKVVGAIGFSLRTGKLHVFKAKATIMCSGLVALRRYRGTAPFLLSADGIMAAVRVGCQLKNLELTLAAPSPVDFNLASGTNLMVGQGGYLVNKDGERFMKRYDPIHMERAQKTVVAIASSMEYLEGRGPVFLDLRHLDAQKHAAIRNGVPMYVKAMDRAGLDLSKDVIRYKASAVPCLGAGGIRINIERATTIPGLYAAGSCSDHAEDGAENSLGNGMDSAVGGRVAGRYASEYVKEVEPPSIKERQVEALAKNAFQWLRRAKGITARNVNEDIDRIWESIEVIRSEKSLNEAIRRSEEVEREKVPTLWAKDYHTLAGILGVINKVSFLGFFSRAALMRTESRGAHYRLDYPQRNDKNWLKWVICQQKGQGAEVWTEPVPFEKYPLKPPIDKEG